VPSSGNAYLNAKAAVGTTSVSTTDTFYVTGSDSQSSIYGFSTASAGTGVLGIANTGAATGVWGQTSSTTALASGIYGNATGNSTTGATYGVWGTTANTYTGAAGVYGTFTGTSALSVMGVYGATTATGSSAAGVYGIGSGGSNAGVFGTVSAASGVGVRGSNTNTGATTTTAIGIRGTAANNSASAVTNASRGVSGEFTGASGFGYGIYGTSASSSGSTAGVFGTVTASTGAYSGVHGQIPSSGSSTAYGVKGENLNTTGGVGVYAYTASSSGRALYAMGSVYIENQGSAGSATSATDILLARTNSGGYCGFNSSGQSFNASDRNVKENFKSVSNAEILQKLVDMPITQWTFKNQDSSVLYVGPMAQDFHTAFGLGGSNDRVIHATNAQGVTMAALQGLNTKVEDKTKTLEARLNELEARVVILESALTWSQKIATGNLGIGMALIGVPAVAYRLIRRRRS